MTDTYGVPLKKMVSDFPIEVVFAASDFDQIHLTVEDISRPGLERSRRRVICASQLPHRQRKKENIKITWRKMLWVSMRSFPLLRA